MSHKLRTSREVYDQVRWDPRLDARRIVMGYESRRDGMQEIACLDFVPGGDIPWHRVWYFRDDRQVLWDRRQRLDRLTGPGALTAASAEAGATPHEHPREAAAAHGIPLSPLSVYRFDARTQAWVPLVGPVAPGQAPPATLTVVTYNVLFNLHDAARFLIVEYRHIVAVGLVLHHSFTQCKRLTAEHDPEQLVFVEHRQVTKHLARFLVTTNVTNTLINQFPYFGVAVG